jgi:prophage regulatory protein
MKLEKILPDEGFVRLPALLNVLPFSRSTLWAKVKDSTFPAPIKLGPRITAWHVDSVRQYIDTHTPKVG